MDYYQIFSHQKNVPLFFALRRSPSYSLMPLNCRSDLHSRDISHIKSGFFIAWCFEPSSTQNIKISRKFLNPKILECKLFVCELRVLSGQFSSFWEWKWSFANNEFLSFCLQLSSARSLKLEHNANDSDWRWWIELGKL